jgi:glycosyltransferase involved in cell wall biosynthesis
MTIVLVNKFYYKRAGGERSFFDVKELLESHGHTVVPFAMQHPENESSSYQKYFVSYHEFGRVPRNPLAMAKGFMRMVYSWEAKKKFAQLVEEVRPDIVHIHNIYHQISPSILDVCRAKGLPVVQTVHDYKLVCPNYKLFANGAIDESCKGKRFYRDAWNRSIKHSFLASCGAVLETYIHDALHIYDRGVSQWIAPSHFVKNKIVEFGKEESKISVIPHFIDMPLDNKDRERNDTLLYVGRLSEEKGVDVFLRALARTGYHARILGDGPLRSDLEMLCKKLGLEGQVIFEGHKTPEEVTHALATCRALIVPSVWHELFGYVVLEAYAVRTPVIAARVGALPELIEPVDHRFLVTAGSDEELAQKMEELLQNSAVLKEFGERAHLFCRERMGGQEFYEKIMALYASLATQKIY